MNWRRSSVYLFKKEARFSLYTTLIDELDGIDPNDKETIQTIQGEMDIYKEILDQNRIDQGLIKDDIQ